MKKKRWIVIGVILLILCGLYGYLFVGSKNPNQTAQIEKGKEDTKSLIVYFSRDNALPDGMDAMSSATPSTNGGTGSDTEQAARMIQDVTGADLYTIQVDRYYRKPFMSTAATAWIEETLNIHPRLTGLPESLDEYDTIYIGYPIWWFDAPMAIPSFLENYDLQGKTVIPFCTSQDNDIDLTMDTIKEAAKGANILDGMRFHYTDKEACIEWLKNIGMLD